MIYGEYEDYIHPRKELIKLGDKVISNDGLTGKVVPAGPYGDQPYQIRITYESYDSFIDVDGTCPYSKRIWRKR